MNKEKDLKENLEEFKKLVMNTRAFWLPPEKNGGWGEVMFERREANKKGIVAKNHQFTQTLFLEKLLEKLYGFKSHSRPIKM